MARGPMARGGANDIGGGAGMGQAARGQGAVLQLTGLGENADRKTGREDLKKDREIRTQDLKKHFRYALKKGI